MPLLTASNVPRWRCFASHERRADRRRRDRRPRFLCCETCRSRPCRGGPAIARAWRPVMGRSRNPGADLRNRGGLVTERGDPSDVHAPRPVNRAPPPVADSRAGSASVPRSATNQSSARGRARRQQRRPLSGLRGSPITAGQFSLSPPSRNALHPRARLFSQSYFEKWLCRSNSRHDRQ